jgi:hypothetical protein
VFTKEIEHTDFPLDEIKTVFRQQRDPLAEQSTEQRETRAGVRAGAVFLFRISRSTKVFQARGLVRRDLPEARLNEAASFETGLWEVGKRICC